MILKIIDEILFGRINVDLLLKIIIIKFIVSCLMSEHIPCDVNSLIRVKGAMRIHSNLQLTTDTAVAFYIAFMSIDG